jgi:hypothetical protein
VLCGGDDHIHYAYANFSFVEGLFSPFRRYHRSFFEAPWGGRPFGKTANKMYQGESQSESFWGFAIAVYTIAFTS